MERVDEQWVNLDGLSNYAVSNYGRVINVHRNKELKHTIDKRTGFHKVSLSHKGVKYYVFVHRLVAKCFFLNYQPGVEVLFINGNKDDITVLNLTLGKGCRKGES